MLPLNRNVAWATAIIEELVYSGVHHVVVSPGSRSAALALAAASETGIEDLSILDERSAGFIALGLARASRRPVGLICTSGTAAAGYLPAVLEAHYSHVPLILLTADRPPEERSCGAGQTIEQLGLYGAYVRLSLELPTPALDVAIFRHLRRTLCRAVALSRGPDPGAVHLNVPFREPLAPLEVAEDREPMARLARLDATALYGRAGTFSTVVPAEPASIAAPDLDRVAARMSAEPKGWIVAGPLDASSELVTALSGLARASGWPLLADPLSQLRCGGHDRGLQIDNHDLLLRAQGLIRRNPPRMILRFGAMPTSKPYREMLEASPEIVQIVVDPHDWRDPTALTGEWLRCDPLTLARALLERLAGPPRWSAFSGYWIDASRRAAKIVDEELAERVDLSEPGVAYALSDMLRTGDVLPEGSTLFVASSMPIRDLDAFWRGSSSGVRVAANRGVNGIDGTLSTALGAALAGEGPVILIIGDLALLHDWSGLIAARLQPADLTVVVLDNGGGGIFELLPIATHAPRDVFERHFATDQHVDLEAAARGFGFSCEAASTVDELHRALRRSIEHGGINLLRVPSERGANAELHRKLGAAVSQALDATAEHR